MPGHRPEDQVDFLSFAENADADEGKNLRKWGKGDTPGYGGGRNAFLTSPKNSWYGEDMTPARKAAMAREWIIFALSFGLGGHIALGLVLHCPKCGQQLSEIDYKGVKIDRCMNCQGVWLDAGELEQVTQKAGLLGGFTKLFK